MIMNPAFYNSIHNETTNAKKQRKIGFQLNRLTRNTAKLVLCMIVFTLLFTSFLLMSTNASSEVTTLAANETTVIVGAGDTLWNIARQYTDGRQDIRQYIYEIKERNQLSTVNLMPGQQLIIPNLNP